MPSEDRSQNVGRMKLLTGRLNVDKTALFQFVTCGKAEEDYREVWTGVPSQRGGGGAVGKTGGATRALARLLCSPGAEVS